MKPALQYGGFRGKFGLISLQAFWAGNAELVTSSLKIQCDESRSKVISRDSSGVEEPGSDLTIPAAAKYFGEDGAINVADPSIDSSPIEIRANYITNAPTDFPAVQVNAGDYLTAYKAAFGSEGSTDAKVAWLVKFHAPITAQEAAAYLSK